MIFKITANFSFVSFLKTFRKDFYLRMELFSGKTERFQTHNTVLENQNLRKLPFFLFSKMFLHQ